jgi:alcohol dehydrogenase class IV
MQAEACTPTEQLEFARKGLAHIRELSRQCNIPAQLRDFNIPENAIERMARGAMTVTRLLERNVRDVKLQDAIDIYRRAF